MYSLSLTKELQEIICTEIETISNDSHYRFNFLQNILGYFERGLQDRERLNIKWFKAGKQANDFLYRKVIAILTEKSKDLAGDYNSIMLSRGPSCLETDDSDIIFLFMSNEEMQQYIAGIT